MAIWELWLKIKGQRHEETAREAYNGDAVVVNVCLVVQLLLNLGVLLGRPGREVSALVIASAGLAGYVLETGGVEGRLVDGLRVGNHFERAGMEIVLLLLLNLLASKVSGVERAG